ncbi:DUF4838 domain-containing protein [Chitinophaga polysaccharea]|uniref:DUF4838 domain-containing protein n=1 Tax=Chitinophaga polysaccharea TaxID=1293035 RepID=UPI001455789E|nr:DUF4838 domain-containing protein [Chitinophaga polysaccharea]NLR61864.1 DUF4838 domain-containing protein [Chitinophaga polysaccharea]
MIVRTKMLFAVVVLIVLPMLSFTQCLLVNNKKSNFAIVIPDAGYSSAAFELQEVIYRATTFKMPVRQGTITCSNCIVIGQQSDFSADPSIRSEKLSKNGVLIGVQKNRIALVSQSKEKIGYSVTEFLKTYFNAEVFDTTGVVVDLISNVKIPEGVSVYNPPFEYRDLYYKSAFDSTFMEWNKINHIWASKNSEWGNWVHTAYEFIFVPTYYKSNPEYFALINNKRVTTQLCYSNPDVYQIVLKNLKEKIKKAPEKKIWSFSQLDNNDICQCDNCHKADQRLGTHGAALFEFVNRLANDIPDKTIATLAYGFSLKPPAADKFKLAPNVLIVYCVTQGNKGRDMATDVSFNDMRLFLTGWTGLTKNIIIWDYIVNFPNLLMPLPNFKGIADALKYYRSLGIKEVFLQGNAQKGGDFAGLRSYVAAQLLWNPDKNLGQLIKHYSDYAYGPASNDIQQLINDLSSNGQKAFINYYFSPDSFSKNMFAPDKMGGYYNEIVSALKKVSANSRYYDNLLQIKLGLDYTNAELQRVNKNAVNTGGPSNSLMELQKYSNTKLMDIPINEGNKTLKDYINSYNKASGKN